jgi:hypothetical protein
MFRQQQAEAESSCMCVIGVAGFDRRSVRCLGLRRVALGLE